MLVILIKTIEFVDFDDKQIVIPANTEVFIDTQEGIAFHNDYHFDIDSDEYAILQ